MESKFIPHFFILITFFLLPFVLYAQLSSTSGCQQLSLQAQIKPACAYGSNGSISINVSNGLPPYRVKWKDGNDKFNRIVSPGNYQVTVTDALGCETTESFRIDQHPEIQVAPQVKDVTREGKSNGAITLNVRGGTPPYHYSWMANNGQKLPAASPELQQLNKLSAGTYKIVIFDASGCYTELETEIR